MYQGWRRKHLYKGSICKFNGLHQASVATDSLPFLQVQELRYPSDQKKIPDRKDRTFSSTNPLSIQVGSVVSATPHKHIDLRTHGDFYTIQTPAACDFLVNDANTAGPSTYTFGQSSHKIAVQPCDSCQNFALPSLASVISCVRLQQWDDVNLMGLMD
jgi:hypothetical protein